MKPMNSEKSWKDACTSRFVDGCDEHKGRTTVLFSPCNIDIILTEHTSHPVGILLKFIAFYLPTKITYAGLSKFLFVCLFV